MNSLTNIQDKCHVFLWIKNDMGFIFIKTNCFDFSIRKQIALIFRDIAPFLNDVNILNLIFELNIHSHLLFNYNYVPCYSTLQHIAHYAHNS